MRSPAAAGVPPHPKIAAIAILVASTNWKTGLTCFPISGMRCSGSTQPTHSTVMPYICRCEVEAEAIMRGMERIASRPVVSGPQVQPWEAKNSATRASSSAGSVTVLTVAGIDLRKVEP